MALNGMNQFIEECSLDSDVQPKHFALPYVKGMLASTPLITFTHTVFFAFHDHSKPGLT